MNRHDVIKAIISSLEENLLNMKSAAEAAKSAATHTESKAESKWDTFGLEASYLAGAQASRANEITEAIAYYQSLVNKEPEQREKIFVEAIIKLVDEETSRWYFLGMKGAGVTAFVSGVSIFVVSPNSPLGSQLLGKEEGDEVQVKTEKRDTTYEVDTIIY